MKLHNFASFHCLTLYRKYGFMGHMKTTLEIPDALFRQAKASAALKGQSLKGFVVVALHEKLSAGRTPVAQSPWQRFFGSFRNRAAQIRNIQTRVDREFSRIDPEEWR